MRGLDGFLKRFLFSFLLQEYTPCAAQFPRAVLRELCGVPGVEPGLSARQILTHGASSLPPKTLSF